jgi:hypothetical protein
LAVSWGRRKKHMANTRSAAGTEPAAQPQPGRKQTVDVTGLSEEAVRAVEQLVSHLRDRQAGGVPVPFSSRQEWAKAVREWAESHPRRDTLADDSRESIYPDRV